VTASKVDKELDKMDEAMGAKKPEPEHKPKVVQISHNHSGMLHALREDGKLFKYAQDPAFMNQPGVHMTWVEMPTP
jgi:hypothetical protein